MKEIIKEAVAKILYLESPAEIKDDIGLFTELGMSSIDYVDLCYELRQRLNLNEEQAELWPVNKMMLDKQFYDGAEWTNVGWQKICDLIGINQLHHEKMPIGQIHQFFSVNYLERKIKAATA